MSQAAQELQRIVNGMKKGRPKDQAKQAKRPNAPAVKMAAKSAKPTVKAAKTLKTAKAAVKSNGESKFPLLDINKRVSAVVIRKAILAFKNWSGDDEVLEASKLVQRIDERMARAQHA